MKRRYHIVPKIILLGLLVIALCQSEIFAQDETLSSGSTARRKITAETHRYALNLAESEYCGIDISFPADSLSVRLLTPGGSEIMARKPAGRTGNIEKISFIFTTSAATNYTLEISKPAARSARPLFYTIGREQSRTATGEEIREYANFIQAAALDLFTKAYNPKSGPDPTYLKNAIANYKEALGLRERSNAADSLTNIVICTRYIGVSYLALKETVEAIGFLERAFELLPKLEAQNPRGEYKAARTMLLNDLGRAYFTDGQDEKALSFLDRVNFDDVDYWKKNKPVLLESSGLLLDLYVFLGDEDYKRPIEVYKEILNRARIYEFDDPVLLDLYGRLGDACLEGGYYNDSLKSYGKAMEINLSLRKKPGPGKKRPDREMLRALSFEEARLYNNVGIVYLRSGNFEEAEKNILLAINITAKQKDEFTIIEWKANLGGVLARQKKYTEALKYFDETLPKLKKFRDDFAAKFLKTKEFSDRALAKNLSAFVVVISYYYGMVLREMGKVPEAIKIHGESVDLAVRYKLRKYESRARTELGLDYLAAGKNESSTLEFERANDLATAVNTRDDQIAALDGLMRAWTARGDGSLAVVYGKQSVNLLQKTRSELEDIGKSIASQYVKDNEYTYRQLANLLIIENRFRDAQIALNLLKLEEFKELLAHRAGDDPETIPYHDAETELIQILNKTAALSGELRNLERCEGDAGCTLTTEQKKRIADIRTELASVNRAYEAIQRRLKEFAKNNTTLAVRINQIESMEGLSDILKTSPFKTVAIYTLITTEEGEKKVETAASAAPSGLKNKSFGWAILEMENVIKAYPIDTNNLNHDISELQTILKETTSDPKETAQRIYNKVFRQRSTPDSKTLEEDLKEYFKNSDRKVIMWSLDGILRYVPMAALHDGQNYLVQEYIQTVFTPKSIMYFPDAAQRVPYILGLGVSRERRVDGESFDELSGVEDELTLSVNQSGETRGLIGGIRMLNEQFTKDEALKQIRSRSFSIVHFATHYKYFIHNSSKSFLITGDGKITLEDLEERGLFSSVDILTVSACETGATQDGYGKDAEGLPFSAQRGGAKTVIASLWKVSDRGTPELMIQFYRNRVNDPALTKGEAFQLAQMALLKGEVKELPAPGNRAPAIPAAEKKGKRRSDLGTPDEGPAKYVWDPQKPYAHPHYWAAFVMTGNWR